MNPNAHRRGSYWKLNSSVLKHEAVSKMVHSLIQRFWCKSLVEKKFCNNWELLKFELSKFLRTYTSSFAKTKRAEEENVISEITSITQKIPENLSENEHSRLIYLQNKLDDIYRMKAEGAFVRSRKRWLEEGEQNSAYFFRLEKFQAKINTIQKLNIDGDITDDPRKIAKYSSEFYTKLYESKYNNNSTCRFLRSLTDTKKIDMDSKESCDKPIILQEIICAIENLKSNKSPGPDGLTSELYKTFSKQLAPFLQELFLECINNESLPPTLTQGLITLIPKPKKDLLFIDNWRPICLLNNDYKIFAHIFAKRIKSVLENIIDESQSGFMENRHISNNIRLVLDLIDYSHLCPDDSFILFLDFYKAFDTIEHEFIFHALEKFGFGSYFSSAIKTMYTNGNCTIRLNAGTSPRFFLKRGVRQGCPISPYLFLLCTQLLTDAIKLSPIKGITAAGQEIIISQLADDTTLFLKNSSQIPLSIDLINSFSAASGLCLNIKKCELLAIKHCDISSICGIPVKDSVNYLGICITKDKDSRCPLNFNSIIDRTQKKLNQWLQRDLSLRGRILLTKAEGLSRLTYAALSLDVNKKVSKDINKMLFNFIWKNKKHYIKKSVIMNSYEKGGLNFLDFDTLNNTFKINWLKQFIRNPFSIWNFIPNFVFSKLGGLNFLLFCNYNVNKIPLKLSNFHKQMLLSWSLIYKHNFSPHRYYIWNNKDILHKNKSLFFSNWFIHNIVSVNQLLKSDGSLMTYQDFLTHYGPIIPCNEFSVVINAIPAGAVILFKGFIEKNPTQFNFDPTEPEIGQICFSSLRNSNRGIRSLFQKDVVSTPHVTSYWNTIVNNLNWKVIWTLPSKYIITNKVKEVSFKIIHRIYPSKIFLQRFNNNLDTTCSFCEVNPEDTLHLFWSCPFSVIFWKNICTLICNSIDPDFSLCFEHVLFGLTNYPI
uniref:Reverse transcriptase domain-containing protein n=1 Tax=Kryptolebias marmoratus TaxID=37003 RepID=A0A3Q3BIJ9_KRYMA